MSETDDRKHYLKKILKRRVLDRVLSPDFNDSADTIVSLNALLCRLRDMQNLPEDHKAEIDDMRREEALYARLEEKRQELRLEGPVPREPRAIRQLNLIEKLRSPDGPRHRWTAADAPMADASGGTAIIAPPSPLLH